MYFQSGDYWFDNVDQLLFDSNVRASAGHPGSEPHPPDSCDQARAEDPNAGGVGATFYLGGNSRLRLDSGGSLDMYSRKQGDFFVSVQALSATDGFLPASNPGLDRALVRTRTVGSVHLVIHGLVWSPDSPIFLYNPSASTVHQFLGGMVAQRLEIGDSLSSWSASLPDVVTPANGACDAVIRLRSTSTRDGVSTTVEAIVQYRPQTSDVNQRVAVNSSRVVD